MYFKSERFESCCTNYFFDCFKKNTDGSLMLELATKSIAKSEGENGTNNSRRRRGRSEPGAPSYQGSEEEGRCSTTTLSSSTPAA